jgi:hypothetical protein
MTSHVRPSLGRVRSPTTLRSTLRLEIRIVAEQDDEVATILGLQEAELFLRTVGFGYKALRAAATDMAEVWAR